VDNSTERAMQVMRAIAERFDGVAPATTIIGISQLALPTMYFEIEAVAHIDA
jgi:enamine deaminase RidA (YjgF/YER057c/UK114 family)